MSAVTETAVIFLGVDGLAWPALIAVRRVTTPGVPLRQPPPQSTAGAVQGDTVPAPAGSTPPAVTRPDIELIAVGSGVRDTASGQFAAQNGEPKRKRRKPRTEAA